MRCIKCPQKASVELRRHNSAFCGNHYLEFVRTQVARNIRRNHMFTDEDRILVTVSGGKDSLALWDLLMEAGYQTWGLHLLLGIGDYSQRSAQRTREFAQERGAQLIEMDLEATLGLGITGLSQALKRAPCSGCGLSKRYFFNKIALDQNFTVVATGHNLDDEAATLMGNVIHWQMDALGRQSPVLESTHHKLVKKVKPLFSLTEREMASYCLIKGISYVEEECPNATGAHSLLYKDVLNRIESESPGSKQQFLQGFLDRMRPRLQEADGVVLRECDQCGQTTTGQVCSFCRTWAKALAPSRSKP